MSHDQLDERPHQYITTRQRIHQLSWSRRLQSGRLQIRESLFEDHQEVQSRFNQRTADQTKESKSTCTILVGVYWRWALIRDLVIVKKREHSIDR